MFKLSAIVLASTIATAALAQDATKAVVKPAAATETSIVPAALLEQFKAVCASKAKKSKALTKACETNTPPAVTKKGARFKAAKGGAEVNILYSNIEFFK